MKKILLVFLISLALCGRSYADGTNPYVIGAGVSAGGVTCTVDNDSVVDSYDNNDTSTGVSSNVWRAMKFTIPSGGRTITSVEAEGAEAGDGVDTVTFDIYTDSSGDPGALANANLSKTITCADLSDSASWQVWAFDSTASLSAGSYWIVQKQSAESVWDWAYDNSNNATYVYKYSSNSGSSWDEYDAAYSFRVTGCTN